MKNKIIESPLVSVLVITYNSSKYIEETLNSIYNQTFKSIELIISDDASTDSTISICENWLKIHEERFFESEIITIGKNTGVAPNFNRGILHCRGIWIKPIAGDDILMNDCIELNYNYVSQTKYNFVGSEIVTFPKISSNSKMLYEKISKDQYESLSSNQQYQFALRGGALTPSHITWFYKKTAILNYGLYDETIPMMEDRPLKLKVLKGGDKIGYFPKVTVKYRIHEGSISNSKVKVIYTDWQINTFNEVKRKHILPFLPFWEKLILRYDIYISILTHKSVLNKDTLFNRLINYILKIPVKQLQKLAFLRLKRHILNENS